MTWRKPPDPLVYQTHFYTGAYFPHGQHGQILGKSGQHVSKSGQSSGEKKRENKKIEKMNFWLLIQSHRNIESV